MEPYLADIINSKKVPKFIRYIIVCLLCALIIFLGIMIFIRSELILGKIFGIVLSIFFLIIGIYLIFKIRKN